MTVSDTNTALVRMIQSLAIEVSLPDEESSFDIGAIMDNILTAETEEEVFARQSLNTTATKDYTNKPFTLKGEDITWRKSAQAFIDQGAFPFFALFKATDTESGEEITLNGGGATFCAVLRRLQELGGFDDYPDGRPLMIVGKPTLSGQEVITLRPLSTPKTRAKK